jgi:hypothetical protein
MPVIVGILSVAAGNKDEAVVPAKSIYHPRGRV